MIIKEALANGRLTSRGDVPLLRDTALTLGATPDALALGVALAQPWADVTLSGASTVAQLESNLDALALDVSPDLVDQLGSIREKSDAYWHTRAALPWN